MSSMISHLWPVPLASPYRAPSRNLLTSQTRRQAICAVPESTQAADPLTIGTDVVVVRPRRPIHALVHDPPQALTDRARWRHEPADAIAACDGLLISFGSFHVPPAVLLDAPSGPM